MNKHAYLIMAHNEPKILQLLVKSIDDYRNDIFLHIDAKSDFASMTNNLKVKFSKLYYIDRNDIRWGDYSQIKTELDLFSYAKETNKYRYFHLLSGVDLPIKSQDYIHALFEKNDGKEFIKSYVPAQRELDEKVLVRNFFTKHLQSKYFSLLFRGLRKLLVCIQLVLHIKRPIHIGLRKGNNWLSITNDFVSYLLSNKQTIYELFRYSCCGDEIFIQSILHDSSFQNQIYEKGDLRLINWTNENTNSPLCFKNDDFDRLAKSDCIFARKFSSKNLALAEKVIKELAVVNRI